MNLRVVVLTSLSLITSGVDGHFNFFSWVKVLSCPWRATCFVLFYGLGALRCVTRKSLSRLSCIGSVLMRPPGLWPVACSYLQPSLLLTLLSFCVILRVLMGGWGEGRQTCPGSCCASPTTKTLDFFFFLNATHNNAKPPGHKSWHCLIPERLLFKLIKKRRLPGKCDSYYFI